MPDISQGGINFIKKEEGVRNTVYRDSRGLPTVGVGHLVRIADNLSVGDTITPQEVDTFLHDDLAWVVTALTAHVTVDLNQNQFDALCSLVFNIGERAFVHSTVLACIQASSFRKAADAFLMWKNAGGKPVLLARRERERALFLSPVVVITNT
jgi:lysozyme